MQEKKLCIECKSVMQKTQNSHTCHAGSASQTTLIRSSTILAAHDRFSL